MTAAKPDIHAPDDSGAAISETDQTWLRADREAGELAGLCSRAAGRIEELVGATSPDAWTAAGFVEVDACSPWDADWIATMNPGVAPPLVTWLRDVADLIAKVAPSWVASGRPLTGPDGFGGVPVRAAVEFARVVLGEPGVAAPGFGQESDDMSADPTPLPAGPTPETRAERRREAPPSDSGAPQVSQGGSRSAEASDGRTGAAAGADKAFTEIRTQLVRVGLAHGRRAEVAVAALPEGHEEAPPWLLDAWRGSSMAALCAHTLAAVLEDVEERLTEEDRGDLRSMVDHWLENGVEDENLDVWPAEATA